MKINPCLHLAEILTSRLCHDLITPIGAINTGLELFQEVSPDNLTESEEILNLILNSAQTASSRASFYRVAFGCSGGNVSFFSAKELIEKFFVRSKLQIYWKERIQKDFQLGQWGRLLLNSVLWIGECAPRGGLLYISIPQQDRPVLSLRLKAESIILHQGTLEALEGKSNIEDITPRIVPCYLIHTIIKDENGKIEINKLSSPSELHLEITMDHF